MCSLPEEPSRSAGKYFLVLVCGLLVLGILACGLTSRTPSPVSTSTPEAPATLLTAEAQATTTAAQRAVDELTRQAEIDAPTAVFLTPTPGQIPLPTLVPPAVPTPTDTFYPCDVAEFIYHVTVPPDTSLPSGAQFIKTWRVKNIGTCTWTPQYAITHTGGDAMTGSTSNYIPGTVHPGQIIDLSVNLGVPPSTGIYQGTWMLKNEANKTFGSGYQGSVPFLVRVQTFPYNAPKSSGYDFALNYCAAKWRSRSGPLTCPGSTSEIKGFAVFAENPVLETGQTSWPVLWTKPDFATNGFITGTYPSYTVADGDRFLAEVGCFSSSPDCDLTFQLDYESYDGDTGRLGSWREFSDRRSTTVDVNLSSLAGQTVKFLLSVTNNGEPLDANGFWLNPHISRQTSGNLLVWSQTGRTATSCDELRINWSVSSTLQAEAFSCQPYLQSLGSRFLTTAEDTQMREYAQRLEQFDAEIFRSTTIGPLNTQYVFYGLGLNSASSSEIYSINSLAESIFLSIIN